MCSRKLRLGTQWRLNIPDARPLSRLLLLLVVLNPVVTPTLASGTVGTLAPRAVRAGATSVYYVDPRHGKDVNDGLTPATAWRSIDRGQPTKVRQAMATGAKQLKLTRAVQLPHSGTVRVELSPGHTPEDVLIHYNSRDGFTLLGIRCDMGDCPALPRGALVHSESTPPPKPGSVIKALPGVYAFPWNETTASALPLAHYDAAYFVTSSLTLQGTVDQRTGRPLSVIDGRSISKTAVTVAGGINVTLSGFDIRRGAVFVTQANGFSLTRSRIHSANTGVKIAYSNNVTLTQNLVFDITGGSNADAVAVHSGADFVRVVNNTISNCNYGIHVYASSVVSRPGIVIRGNVVTRCIGGAGIVAEPNVQLSAVGHNNIWLTGKGGGLKQLSEPQLSRQLHQYYNGLNQSSIFAKKPPHDLHEDPEIVSFNEGAPGFLCAASRSTTAAARAGACTWKAPVLEGISSPQGVLNSDFSAGMWAWQGHTFPANPNASGLPIWRGDSARWFVSPDGCAEGQAPCAQIHTAAFANGTMAGTRLRSAAFDVTRTRRTMNFTLNFIARATTADSSPAGRASACITVVDWDDEPFACQALKLNNTWSTHKLFFALPSWLPATVSASFVVDGSLALWLDNIELRQVLGAAAPSGCSSPAVNFLLQDPPTDTRWQPGSEIRLAVRPSIFACPNPTVTAVSVHHQLLTASGTVLVKGTSYADVGKNYTVEIPTNATGATLLNLTASDQAGIVVARFTYRLLIANSLATPEDPGGFAFCTTLEWHVQAALLSSGLLEKQLVAERALGLNCHHVYLQSARMLQMLNQPFAAAVAQKTRAAGVHYLFTLFPNAILDGECGKPGVSCPTKGAFPVSHFCHQTVAGLVPPSVPQPRPGKTTPAQLERVCELVLRLAQMWAPFVRYWALEGEPESNGLVTGEYAARVLPVLSAAVREGAGPAAVLVAGSFVNDFRDSMWNNTVKRHELFDAFGIHPYRFNRLDPDADCLGMCGSTFRSQVVTATNDLARAGAKNRGPAHRPAIFLTEEASGNTLQRSRAVGWSPFGGYDLSMRLATFSQEELLNANYIARMWVTAIGEGAVGYNEHGGSENLLFLDDIGTPTLGAIAIHTIAVTLKLGVAHSAQQVWLENATDGLGPGPGNVIELPRGPFRAYVFDGPVGVVTALWVTDAEFAIVDKPAMLGEVGLDRRDVTVINTFGNSVSLVTTGGDDLGFQIGRNVIYLIFHSEGKVSTTEQAANVTKTLLRPLTDVVSSSCEWPTPYW